MKTRNGFVSNSSSSSFIVELDRKGCFKAEGYGDVNATVGVGFEGDLLCSHQEAWELESDDTFSFVFDYEQNPPCAALVRSFSQMKDEQTMAQFKEETTELVHQLWGKQIKNIKGPMFLAAGRLGVG